MINKINQKLDPQIKRWLEEQSQDYYKYLFTNALYFYVRVDHQAISCPVSISITKGVDKNGHRKILDVDFAFEESYQGYLNHFNRIKERMLKHVDLAISNDNKGVY